MRRPLLGVALLLASLVTPGAVHGQSAGATFWSPTDGPTAFGNDQQSVEVGLKFSADQAGSINSIRFYKRGALSAHTVSLWTSSGTLIGRATSTTETSTGWQQVDFAVPVAITAGTTYVASYHSTGYASTQHYLETAGLDVAPLHAPSTASSGGNGVYLYSSAPSFPTNAYLGSNYWVDVVFAPDPNAPTPTPTATSTSTPTPTPTASSSATPTPTSVVSPTPTPTPTNGFACTEVIGFSETEQWYDGGFAAAVPDLGLWQLRWYSGGSIDLWADSSFAGWGNGYLVSACRTSSGAPDRVVLNVSGNYNTDSSWWAQETAAAIANVRAKYTAVKQIVVQPVVGGPSGSLCGDASSPPSSWVRASYNFPTIKAGLQQVLGADVALGADPQVRSCADYLDTTGHLATAAQPAIGGAIAAFYTQPAR